jgi:hypothetical protein
MKKPAEIPARKYRRPNLLTDDDRKALTAEARKSVLEGLKQDERDAWFEEERLRLRRESVPEEQLVFVTIDTAPFLAFIMLDNVQFFNGYTYEVPQSQAAVILEQMHRSWRHQDEIDGRGKTEAHRPLNTHLGPRHAGTPTRGQNGPVVAEI